MKYRTLRGGIFLIVCASLYCCLGERALADDGYQLWLKYKEIDDVELLKQYQRSISSFIVMGESETCRVVRDELTRGLSGLLGKEIPSVGSIKENSLVVGTPRNSEILKRLLHGTLVEALGREGFMIKSTEINGDKSIVIAANEDIGLLHGTFRLLQLIQAHRSLGDLDIVSKPKIQYRLLNHWDNLDGSIERGYAGKSLWKWSDLPDKIEMRYRDYARANASIGINGAILNNVNANPIILTTEYLKKVAALADVFRPYGIRVFLSVNFASPISGHFELEGNRKGGIGNLDISDPLNPEVRLWWKNKVKEIYQLIPNFGGFLVKANSEGMPGPQDYNRTHADGANMLAEALEPYDGVVMWRAFVYNPEVDPDRVKRAYKEFVPLDGKFRDNVFVQAKNGPLDFQPREPVQPLFGAMPNTPLMLELQITQEYLGHSTHLVYLAPMWKEYLEFDFHAKGLGSTLAKTVDGTLTHSHMTGIAGVANTGDDRNWCGHLLAQANWFAFGRLAWDHTLTADEIADDWIRMTLGSDSRVVATVKSMMLASREACVNYMTPLGLHHIMQPDFHYGPGPQHDTGRVDWRSVYYHRADSIGLGFDRSSSGSNAVAQYYSPLRETFDNIDTCPEKYLLWFHHVSWNHRMKSGKTLWEELCRKYDSGTEYVDDMIRKWRSLKASIDPEIHAHVRAKLEKQKVDAAIWRDTCLEYFHQFSRKAIIHPQQ
ncbi:MAG: alpha-glucuronidase family glycosyl hydrolase [Bacteroidota bacterium]